MEKPNKLLIQCDCHGSEFVTFLKYEDDGDPDYHDIYVSFFGCEINSFKRRLKMAWRILCYGEYENDGLMLWDEREKLIKWLQDLK